MHDAEWGRMARLGVGGNVVVNVEKTTGVVSFRPATYLSLEKI
jgi:hypothetical protein